MILLPKAAVDRNAQLDAGEVAMVWRFGWWGLKRVVWKKKYTSSPYWEVIFTDEILRVFLRDLHDPMSLNKASACFSVNTLDFAKAFYSYSRRDNVCWRMVYVWTKMSKKSLKWHELVGHSCYLLSTLNSYLVFSIQYLCLVFCRQSWCLCVANMEKEETIHPHRRRSSIFAGVFCSLEASGRE